MKFILKSVFLFLIFIITSANISFAENFYIKDYNVSLKVNNDKSVDVIEDIDTYFTNSSHGIYRTVPHENAKVRNIEVSERFSKTDDGNTLNIKIGDPDKYVSGAKHYTIIYTYQYTDNKNEFYHNIIGTKWTVPIHKASFMVEMPKEFNANSVGLSIGEYGKVGFSGGASYSVVGNKIVGNITRQLYPGEGVTIRVEVPAGYFDKYTDYTKYVVLIIAVMLTIISYITWYIYGKDEHVTPVVNFYPPKELNAVLGELAYKGKATVKGLVALLIELAANGYISIAEDNKNFTLRKLKNPPENTTEKKFINALFPGNSNIMHKSVLEKSKSYYQDCKNIIDEVNQVNSLIFEKTSISAQKKAIMFLCLAGIVFSFLFTLFNYNLSAVGEYCIVLIFPFIALTVLVCSNNRDPFTIIWSLLFGGPALILFIASGLSSLKEPVYFGIITVCLIISIICAYHLPKRNSYGRQLLGRLRGLKKFMEVAEKNRLTQLVEKDPKYFYKVLPYAYILGVSSKWINKFEDIMSENPDWYSGHSFYHNLNSFAHTMESLSVPSTSNGGISTSSGGGGGCSGGGGGGGGGGSW